MERAICVGILRSPCYIDAVWIKDNSNHNKEFSGRKTRARFPVSGEHVVVCEAKMKLNPELIGQALTHSFLLERAGATVDRAIYLLRIQARPLKP